MIFPSAGMLVGTVLSVGSFVLIGWLVLVVRPRHVSAAARRFAARREGT